MQKRGFSLYIEILSEISNNKKICIRNISEKTGIAEQHIRKAINYLITKNVLKREKGKGKRKDLVLTEEAFVKKFLKIFNS
jgi:DNA-binding transcriptional regulator GbsR (MarR family)